MAATSNMETFTISNKFFSFYFSQVSFETLREKKEEREIQFFFFFFVQNYLSRNRFFG